MTVTAVKPKATPGPAQAGTPGPQAAKPPPPAAPSRRRGITPLTPMRQAAAKSMRKLAAHVQESHPDMSVHDHLRDAARTLESGNEEASQRHLRAAMFALTPQSLMRNGLHTDDHHVAARGAMHDVHRHLLLVKDIADVGAKNQARIARLGGEDDTAPRPADPNAGYGPGANAQKPTVRQPPGNQALNAPNKSDGGGSDPAVADPDRPPLKMSKQFSYGWDDLARVIELAASPEVVDLVGPKGYIHGWIYVGGAGLPSVASHDAKLRAKGVTPPTRAHPALTSKPPSVKAAPKAAAARPAAAVKAAPKPAATASKAPAVKAAPAVKRSLSDIPDFARMNMSKDERKQYLQTGDLPPKIKGWLAKAKEPAPPPAPAKPKVAPNLLPPVKPDANGNLPAQEKQRLVLEWTGGTRYSNVGDVSGQGGKRAMDFVSELHRLLSTNKPPDECGMGCQDAHSFLAMVDHGATAQKREMQRGIVLSSAKAQKMFGPGSKKTMDLPAASWSVNPDVAKEFSGGNEPEKGKTQVVLHAAPGAKGLDIASMSLIPEEQEVVSGGRFNVDKVQNVGGVMHVYVTQQAFSAH